jgi:hypothetical protein
LLNTGGRNVREGMRFYSGTGPKNQSKITMSPYQVRQLESDSSNNKQSASPRAAHHEAPVRIALGFASPRHPFRHGRA